MLSVFCGNDYIGHLQRFTIGQKAVEGRRGKAYNAMKHYSSLQEPQARLQYLQSLERENRWSDGDSAPAQGFTTQFCRTLGIVYHYPVYHLTFTQLAVPADHVSKRKLFVAGDFTVKLCPLNPFMEGITWTRIFPDDWGREIADLAAANPTQLKDEVEMRRWARGGQELRPVPHPINAAGEPLCHGAILNFDERVVPLHSTIALQRWLKSRNLSDGKTRRETYLGTCPPHPLTL